MNETKSIVKMHPQFENLGDIPDTFYDLLIEYIYFYRLGIRLWKEGHVKTNKIISGSFPWLFITASWRCL